MRITLRAGLTAALALAAPAAMAQSGATIYLEVEPGTAIHADADNAGSGVAFDTGFGSGFTDGGALSFTDPRGLRGELELSYRENEVDETSVINLGPRTGNADISAFTALANAYYDFDTHSSWRPFVGAGIGITIGGADSTSSDFGRADNEGATFTYQAGAGLAYELSPHWTFSLGYRYLGATDSEFRSPRTGTFESEYSSHSVLGGIRFTY